MNNIKARVAKNIAYYRNQKGWTQKKLADAIGTTNTTISNWEKNVSSADIESLAKICHELGISISEVYGIDDETISVFLSLELKQHLDEFNKLNQTGRDKVTNYVKDLLQIQKYTIANSRFMGHDKEEFSEELSIPIKIYNQKVSAGLGNYLYDNANEDCEIVYLPQSCVPTGTDFAIRIKGNSMQPKINDKDIVYVRSLPHVEYEKIGVFVIDGEAYCKKIVYEKGKVLFRSLNQEYEDIEILENTSVVTIGEVLGLK